MNFRDLVNKINDISGVQRLSEGVTLAQVAAAEKTAADAAAAKKASGGWGGFTSWDPKTAGDIAVAQLADQNGLPGLFNSKGEFVVASSKRMDGQTGEKPQIAPPTPADWEPLQKLGLVPPNAEGPAGLTNFLSGGKAGQEFDQVKAASDKVNQDRATDELRAGATQRSDAFAKEKIEQLNALVAQLEKTAPAKGQSGQAAGSPAASGPVSWKQIYDMNKDVIGSNPNLIKPGQELKLPNGSTYTVKAGDNLSKIAKSLKESVYKFNIAESLLADMDSILENALTTVGKNLPAKGGTSVVKGGKGAADDVIDVVAKDVTPKPGSKVNKGKVAATAAGVAGAGAVGYGVATGGNDKAAPSQSGQAAPTGAGAGRGGQGGPTAAELAQAQKAPAQSGQKAKPAGGTPAQSGQEAAKPNVTPEQQQLVGQIQSVMGELADIEDPAVQAALANARRVLDKYGIPE